MIPTLELLLVNAKLVVSTFVSDMQLKRVDLPTFATPIIPHCKAIIIAYLKFDKGTNITL
jgi:hypothetical protein